MRRLLIISLGLALYSQHLSAQNPYFLDPYFAQSGIAVATNPPWGNLQYRTYNVKSLTIASDDKIIISGNQTPSFSPSGISGGHYAVSKMKADGTVDSSFATNGHKVFSSGDNGNPILTMDILKILPDNKILYAGTQMSNPYSKFVVFKLNVDGSLDNTFGSNGRSVISSGTALWHSLNALGIQSSGKILLLGGNGDNSSPWIGSITRLNSNGSLDNSFGTNGVLQPNLGFNSNNVRYNMIKVLSDNSFLVVGTHVQMTTTADIRQDFVAKFNEQGVLQTNFGNNGKVILPLSNSEILYFYNQDIEMDNNGNIYVNCSTNGGSTGIKSILVYKLNNNGVIDNNFGTNNRLAIPSINYDNWYRYDAILHNDKLLVTGMVDTGVNAAYHLQRYNLDGTEDITFNNPLSYLSNTRNSYDHLYFLGLQSNDRIILGGNGKKDDKSTDSIFPIALRFLERGTEIPPVDTGTSVVNIKDQSNIKIFPNPVNNVINIQGLKEKAQIDFYNLNGQLINQVIINKLEQQIDCTHLPSGTYWLYIKEINNQKVFGHKLVKQ